jgi:hypothetical protein
MMTILSLKRSFAYPVNWGLKYALSGDGGEAGKQSK